MTSKRSKTEVSIEKGKFEEIKVELEKLLRDQTEAEKQLNLEFIQKKKPILHKREQIAKSIPKFWYTVFDNSGSFSFTDYDTAILEKLESIDVDETENNTTIVLTFATNDYLKNKVITISSIGDEPPKITGLEYQSGKEPVEEEGGRKKNVKKGNQSNFFFSLNEEDQVSEILETITSQIWPDAIELYEGDDASDGSEGEENEEDEAEEDE
eukprot:TRINITY_DN587_c1_g1_i1.p1 TRINITY_DN587_c1_g1~~TRINITY_DN587_c1_g1_i1.p1  ORF type:complete len:211 (+),score=121.87 TRINITY_DN587_c1_g1_i1:147-779(+)